MKILFNMRRFQRCAVQAKLARDSVQARRMNRRQAANAVLSGYVRQVKAVGNHDGIH